MASVSLVIIGLFTRLLASSTKNADLTTANLLARGVLDKAARIGKPTWGTQSTFTGPKNTGTVSESVEVAGNDGTTEYIYELRVEKVTDSDKAIGQLYHLTVTVSWWGEKASAKSGRQDYGNLNTVLTRTVYVREDQA